jgi:DNA polymerase III alpha subunit
MPITGVEAYFREDRTIRGDKEVLKEYYHLVLIAKNLKGWHNLLRLTSEAYSTGFYGKPCVDWDLLERYHEGVMATFSCVSGFVPWNIHKGDDKRVNLHIKRMKKLFGEDLYIEIMPHGFDQQKTVNIELAGVAAQHSVPILATVDAHTPYENWHDTHEVLWMISTASSFKQKAEAKKIAQEKGEDTYDFGSSSTDLHTLYLMSEDELRNAFKKNHPQLPQHVVDEAINNTDLLAQKVEPFMVDNTLKMPKMKGGDIAAERLVREWCQEGLKRILSWYPEEHWEKWDLQVYKDQLEYELKIFKDKGVFGYFVVIGDMTRWAKSEGIRVGAGRGSAAGSLALYLMGVTGIDPISHGLMFERFMNPARSDMPDVDIDFQHKRRAEVKQHLGDRWGTKNVADIISYQTFGIRSTLASVARVYDVDYQEIVELTKSLDDGHGDLTLADIFEVSDTLKAFAAKYPDIMKHALRLEGQVKAKSKHAAGVVVMDRPVTDHMPTMKGSDDSIVTAWCLDGDTLVATADGRNAVSMRQLAAEAEDVDVYASDGRRTVIRRMRNPRMTRRDEAMMLVTVDDDNTVRCTPCHRFMMLDGTFKRADELLPDDSLMRFDSVVHEKDGQRRRWIDNCYGPTRSTRKLKGQWLRQMDLIFEHNSPDVERHGLDLHHKDGDSLNDSPTNLELLSKREHMKLTGAWKRSEEDLVRLQKQVDMMNDVDAEERRRRTNEAWKTRHARNHSVKSVELDGRTDVFCGDVDDVQCFAIITSSVGEDFSGVVVHNSEQADFPIISKYGFLKIDVLGTDGLSIQDHACRELANLGLTPPTKATYPWGTQHWSFLDELPIVYDPDAVDPKIIDMFGQNDTFGIFQFEGKGITGLLRQIKPTSFKDLVAANALYRPGPLESGTAFQYGNRKNGREPIEYPGPEAEATLSETYGVMVYQEQAIQIVQDLAGYSKAEADLVRKALTKLSSAKVSDNKGRIELEKARKEFIDRAVAHGTSERAANLTYDELLYFTRYSFNKAHADGYAKQAYEDAWLKEYFPTAFFSGILTYEDDKVPKAIRSAQARGVAVMPPDVNTSGNNFTIDKEGNIRFSLLAVRTVGDGAVIVIEDLRKNGPFIDYEDFENRVIDSGHGRKCNSRQRQALHDCGAFDLIGGRQGWTKEEKQTKEKELLGFNLGGGLTLHSDLIRSRIHTAADAMAASEGDMICIGGEVVRVKPHKTKKGYPMGFIEIEFGSDSYDAVAFGKEWLVMEKVAPVGEAVLVIGEADGQGGCVVRNVITADKLAEEEAKQAV